MVGDRTYARRPWRILLLTALVGAGLVLGAGWLLRDWLPGLGRSDEDQFAPDALAGYVPEDSGAVLTLDLQSIREAPVVRRHLEAPLRHLVRRGEGRLPWLKLAGIDPLADVDWLQLSFAPESGAQPLWLARGRFDRARFQVGPGKLRTKTEDHFRVYEYAGRPGPATTLAPVGDILAFSETPARVTGALVHASHPGPSLVQDPILRELLSTVDRRQSLWLVASLPKLGPVARLDNFALELVLHPIMTHAESVHGGVRCGDDLRAEFHFRAVSEESAGKLAELIQSACGVAQTLPDLPGIDPDLAPLLRLLGTGRLARQGKAVVLRCRLTADQLGE
jgi:hypothetical protein